MAASRRKSPGERELFLLLALEGTINSLLAKKIGGHRSRYAFLKESLIKVRKERTVLEAALNGDPEAKRLRAQGVNNRDGNAVGL